MPGSEDGQDQETESDPGSVGLDDVAVMLAGAWERAEVVPAPTMMRPGTDLADAYRIQDLVVERRSSGLGDRIGWKMGLTSSPDSEPIVGTLLHDMVLSSGVVVSMAGMVAPLVEAELAFIVGEEIASGASRADIAAGPHSLAAALEVIDYRTEGSADVVDWVADNATVAYAVVGAPMSLTEAAAPSEIEVELERDGEPVASGKGSLVMGDPLAAIEWLAVHLEHRGKRLAAGHVVLTGSLTGQYPVEMGAWFRARFDHLGDAEVAFGS